MSAGKPLPMKGIYKFGDFRLEPARRALLRNGEPLPLTPKALDLLLVLVEHRHRALSKQELLDSVWPDTFVEEGILKYNVSIIRKTLGDESWIETLPRLGYRFSGQVEETALETDAPAGGIAAAESIRTAELFQTSVVDKTEVTLSIETALTRTPSAWRLAVAATLIVIAAAGVALLRQRQKAQAPVFRSMAVLPFQMIQAVPGDESLGLGLADAVITRLGGLNKCIVRPTSAVRQFDQTSRDPIAAGTKLGVDAVLDASIQSAGDRLRLNAHLIRVEDGRHLWTGTFDIRRADLFTLEDELAGRFARSLFGHSLPAARYQPKPEAYRLFTLGRYHRNRWTAAGQRKAIEYFEQAVAIDPGYAAAYALMANSWTLQGYFFGMPPREAYPKGEAIAQKALSLDEAVAEAHHSLAAIRFFFDWNFPEAERHARRALELDPNNPDALHVFGLVRTVRHQNAEGIAALQHALEVDPASQWRHVGMTFQYACAGRMDRAIEEAKKAHELDPALIAPMFDLFNLHMVVGRHQEAVAWYLKALERTTPANPAAIVALREKFEKEGIQGFLRARIARHLEQMRAGRGVSPMALAQAYTFLGERDEAIRWIENAVEQKQSTVVFVNQHPMYQSLRDHPRFQELVRRMGL